MMEDMERAGSIDKAAYIVNDKVGSLMINDIEISLPLNVPYSLGNVSAKRIASSKDLLGLIKSGYIKFISPDEVEVYVNKNMSKDGVVVPDLKVFDDHRQAEANMIVDLDDEGMDVTESDLNHSTEDETMIMDLTQNMPTDKMDKAFISQGTTKKSVHGRKT